jgi:hypothetical protein
MKDDKQEDKEKVSRSTNRCLHSEKKDCRTFFMELPHKQREDNKCGDTE